MRVMGIDPGSNITGYGVIQIADREPECVEYGAVRTKRSDTFETRLLNIFNDIEKLVHKFSPDHIAFEDIFYGRNVKSAIQLSHARGVVVLAAAKAGSRITYYSSREVKQAITGYGGASKEQVQSMVQNILNLDKPISPLDASDALAIALCHAFRNIM